MKLSVYGGAFLFGGLMLGCGAAPYENYEGEDGLGEQTAPIQLAYMFAGYHFYVTNTTSAQAKSTAAIRGTNADADTSHASCGATFVSKHFAVTAAHCVNQYALGVNFKVEQFKTVNLNTNFISFTSSTVTGAWPNWTRGPELTGTEGWAKTVLLCHVDRRCHSTEGGVQSCPAGITPDVDIALIHCPDRTGTNFATTTTTSETGRQVETWWFHEILNLPTAASTNERWVHYGNLPDIRNDNFHYRIKHQLFPLLGSSRPDLTPYKNVGSFNTTETGTDMPVCHGTSGSGTFFRGTNTFLGPVISGVFGQARLCEPAENTQPGVLISTHIKSSITNTFVVNSSEVIADR